MQEENHPIDVIAAQMAEVGERLEKERTRLVGRQQKKFADLVGYSANAVSNYERGVRYPTMQFLIAAHKAGVDVAYLITGKKSFYLEGDRAVYESNRPDGFQTSGQQLAAEVANLEIDDEDAKLLAELARKLADK